MSTDIARHIDALRTAVADLRALGLEILGAQASSCGAPSIHVVSPGALPQTARYVSCVLDRATHYAVPYLGCEVIWIDPAPIPGQPPADLTHYTPCERPRHV